MVIEGKSPEAPATGEGKPLKAERSAEQTGIHAAGLELFLNSSLNTSAGTRAGEPTMNGRSWAEFPNIYSTAYNAGARGDVHTMEIRYDNTGERISSGPPGDGQPRAPQQPGSQAEQSQQPGNQIEQPQQPGGNGDARPEPKPPGDGAERDGHDAPQKPTDGKPENQTTVGGTWGNMVVNDGEVQQKNPDGSPATHHVDDNGNLVYSNGVTYNPTTKEYTTPDNRVVTVDSNGNVSTRTGDGKPQSDAATDQQNSTVKKHDAANDNPKPETVSGDWGSMVISNTTGDGVPNTSVEQKNPDGSTATSQTLPDGRISYSNGTVYDPKTGDYNLPDHRVVHFDNNGHMSVRGDTQQVGQRVPQNGSEPTDDERVGGTWGSIGSSNTELDGQPGNIIAVRNPDGSLSEGRTGADGRVYYTNGVIGDPATGEYTLPTGQTVWVDDNGHLVARRNSN